MNHQPYETWILDDVELTGDQRHQMDMHLKDCSECRRLADGWHSAVKVIQTSPEVTLKAGFTRRFMDSLPERKVRRQRSLARRLFWGLSISAGAALMTGMGFLLTLNSPITWIVNSVNAVLDLASTFTVIQSTLQSWLNVIPLPLTLLLALAVLSWFSLIGSAWVFTMWKINQQGVQS